jgi:hypothetical protein
VRHFAAANFHATSLRYIPLKYGAAVEREQVLNLVEQLKSVCRLRVGEPEVFERICGLIQSIRDDATPSVAALALEVRFKSEDLYVRPYLMPGTVLRQMLEDKLLLLEATVRANPQPVERRRAGNMGRRASDRDAAPVAIPAAAAPAGISATL